MDNVRQMANILKENYSLGEIEERFDATSDDLADGLEAYVEMHYDTVSEGLREDLFFLD